MFLHGPERVQLSMLQPLPYQTLALDEVVPQVVPSRPNHVPGLRVKDALSVPLQLQVRHVGQELTQPSRSCQNIL